MSLTDKFTQIAERVSNALGHPAAFLCALILIAGWICTGKYFDWSEAHSLFINTVTTIITFLLGFLILNTSNRTSKAEQLKLDELIRAVKAADNKYIKLEEKTVEDMKEMETRIRKEVEEEV
jgi:low affinity Fe/Cu permease